MGYTHLTKEERNQIRPMQKMESSIREMGNVLNKAPSTISSELRRDRGQRGYCPGQAYQKTCERARTSRTRARIMAQEWAAVAALVRLDWSTEPVSGRRRREGRLAISPEWVYQFVYADKAICGDLCTHLRCPHKRRKRYGSGRERRGRVLDRVGIEKRPLQGADSRSWIGHWEGDTIIGKGYSGETVTLVERKSRFLRIGKLLENRARRHSVPFSAV